MSGKLLLLHQQRLVQLTLVLLDLLLHVGDCTCNLGENVGNSTKRSLNCVLLRGGNKRIRLNRWSQRQIRKGRKKHNWGR